MDFAGGIHVAHGARVFAHDASGGIVVGIVHLHARIAVGDGGGDILAHKSTHTYRPSGHLACGETALDSCVHGLAHEYAHMVHARHIGVNHSEIYDFGAVCSGEESAG